MWLVKYPLKSSLEVWSEKVAAELCGLLGLPHARYELASHAGQPCVISESMVKGHGEQLLVGNEMLGIPKDAATAARRKESKTLHTIANLKASTSGTFTPAGWSAPNCITMGTHVFIGYLMFDTWICNVDRHEQNWGIIAHFKFKSIAEVDSMDGSPLLSMSLSLAPSFDHASSLGREFDDERKKTMLSENMLVAYVNRAQSKIYDGLDPPKRLKLIDAFQALANDFPGVANFWLDKLELVTPDDLSQVFSKIPPAHGGPISVEFAQKMLELTRERLLRCRK
ncbi:MAG TPA: hypothetical protein V6C89_03290 [Drouetiella sp.]